MVKNGSEILIDALVEQGVDTIFGNHRFQIPFDRQQMADYLNLDRSALSKELSRMKKEGILDFHKNEFVLKNEML